MGGGSKQGEVTAANGSYSLLTAMVWDEFPQIHVQETSSPAHQCWRQGLREVFRSWELIPDEWMGKKGHESGLTPFHICLLSY